ncbi:MAG: Hsp20/alpha crystallin family protein [Promethearchaeota archaeon]|nr:MAG: Hsp20/alpha crystallin family protein [Candidatus Lokiarchaeota archaeon]
MPKRNEDEDADDEDDFESPFDFFKFFSDPNKIFRSKQFKTIFKDILDKILKGLPPEFQNFSPEEMRKYLIENKDKFPWGAGPYIAGFNLKFGPDGKPTVDSFGNIKPEPYSGEPEVNSAREPMVEVNEENDQIIVIAEMPGVTKEDVEIKATSRTLTISTKIGSYSRNYRKEVELPCPINSDYAKARLQNGILEVKLKKLDEKHKDIKVD